MGYYKKNMGAAGEMIAVKYLLKNRYRIIEQNYRCKCGEIDIIAEDGEYIVFIEVKTRSSTDFGLPSEAVNYYKRMKIIRTAKQYLLMKNRYNENVRFDVIEIMWEMHANNPKVKSIRLIKNAFQNN